MSETYQLKSSLVPDFNKMYNPRKFALNMSHLKKFCRPDKKLEKQILKFEKKPIKNIRKIALDIIKKL